ncbi:MAG: TRAP transporter substrate-binding protein [Sulfurospirillaceae bacterium]|jgi:TRAP-type C4-dicarboxylate transport system substrate-binding protein|nr:TRAP transporter substrate-binding protein [Sulfurospirillaceae bacterium]MDD2826285.1 TRAP transporter substrate-binding protein [Sulfurospirillaceae bacterium]
MLRKLVVLACVSGALMAANIKMDLNAVYGANNFHTKGAEQFAALVDEYTKGTVKITVHAGGSLIKGSPLQAVKDGTVAMTDMFIPFTAGGGKVFGISALPFVASSYDDAYKLYKISKPAYDKTAAQWNQKLLYAVSWPPSGLYTKKPMMTKADFADLKTRTYDKNSADFITMVGGSSVALPWGEVYSALSTGMVNSVVTSSASGKDGKFWEVLSDFTKISYAYPLQAVTINLDYWKSLDKAQQEAVLKAAAKIEASQWDASKEEDKVALKMLSDNGMKITDESPELKKELDIVAKKMLDAYLADADDMIKKIFIEYKK